MSDYNLDFARDRDDVIELLNDVEREKADEAEEYEARIAARDAVITALREAGDEMASTCDYPDAQAAWTAAVAKAREFL